jgi:glycosyltransferase involved in cell wall biosynthesis
VAVTAARVLEPATATSCPPVAAIRSSGSLGVAAYVDVLAEAFEDMGLVYRPTAAPIAGHAAHFHVANSSRAPLWRAPFAQAPFAVTVHDAVPRTAALAPLYRTLVYPLVVDRAAVTIVHSRFASDLLRRAGARPRRVEVIRHPAPRFSGAPAPADGPPLFVLPGVLKTAKLVEETVSAAAPLISAGRLRLALVGNVIDRRLADAARAAGAEVREAPPTAAYRRLIASADCVLVLRRDSVGETNGPLLDALGAGKPVLATACGSIPEVAGDAARLCAPTIAGIRAGLEALCDPGERGERAALAGERALAVTPERIARAHAELFAEVFDA